MRPGESREHKRSVAIDRILTGKYTALPCFIGIMALVFWLTFGVIGAGLSDLLTLGIDALTNLTDHALTVYGINPVVHSLVIDGIFAGVGSVLSFLPTIVTLFFFLSILEDTGYMARVAFVMISCCAASDFRRSFVPMLIGFGCSVPAIMATRTLSSDRDRKMTILLTRSRAARPSCRSTPCSRRRSSPAVACRRDDRVVHHGHLVRHPVRDPAEIHQVQG